MPFTQDGSHRWWLRQRSAIIRRGGRYTRSPRSRCRRSQMTKRSSGTARAPLGIRFCAHCGSEFPWHRDRTKFCSRACQHTGKTLPAGQVRHSPLMPRPCDTCGGDLRGTALRHNCANCTQALRLAKRTRTCLVCGTPFIRGSAVGESKRVLCGSPSCRKARARTLPSTRSRHWMCTNETDGGVASVIAWSTRYCQAAIYVGQRSITLLR